VSNWSDPRIAALNPGASLPDSPIAVVHRSDGSGTTNIFTDYLSKVSPTWKERVGVGTSVSWPTGLGAKGNEGVTGQVKTTPGALGYVELAYALQNGLPVASLRNRAGRFAEPTLDGIAAAAASAAADMPADFRVSIVDPPGEGAYPLSAFTYILVYEDMPDRARGEALARFLWWAIHDGQKAGPPLHYAPLPAEVVARAEAALRRLRSGGATLLP
jgi:phosphate transport system substrate-binding protein